MLEPSSKNKDLHQELEEYRKDVLEIVDINTIAIFWVCQKPWQKYPLFYKEVNYFFDGIFKHQSFDESNGLGPVQVFCGKHFERDFYLFYHLYEDRSVLLQKIKEMREQFIFPLRNNMIKENREIKDNDLKIVFLIDEKIDLDPLSKIEHLLEDFNVKFIFQDRLDSEVRGKH